MGKINKMIIAGLFLAFNVCLVLFPADTLASAGDGLQLWFNRVMPSLLPFAVGINVLTGLGVTRRLGVYLSPVMKPLFNLPGAASVAVIAGMTSGYPIGAKTAADLRREGLLSGEEARRLAGFCNNAGPLFIVGLVGTAMYGSAEIGYRLLAAHLLSALAIGVGLGMISKIGERNKKQGGSVSFRFDEKQPADVAATAQPVKTVKSVSIGYVLGEAVKNAMDAMTLVGGLIALFSVFTRILTVLGLLSGLASGLLEVTNGVKALAEAGAMDTRLKLALTAGVISFGGLSVHAQAAHFLSQAEIKPSGYLLCKVIHGLLAAGVMYLITYITC
jgi:sporulation integral membrane protein YlbJ